MIGRRPRRRGGTASSPVEMRLRAVEDELAIHALACRFVVCVNDRDFCGFAELWSAHALWEIGPPFPARAEGVDDIVGLLRGLLAQQTSLLQTAHLGLIRLEGDTATARFVKRERAWDGVDRENVSYCHDELSREADGRWRFTRRSHVFRFTDGPQIRGDDA